VLVTGQALVLKLPTSGSEIDDAGSARHEKPHRRPPLYSIVLVLRIRAGANNTAGGFVLYEQEGYLSVEKSCLPLSIHTSLQTQYLARIASSTVPNSKSERTMVSCPLSFAISSSQRTSLSNGRFAECVQH
jgi:hypothetical protein